MNRSQTLKLISNLSDNNDKLPMIIELAGTPNSGKTTIINELDTVFRRYNINSKVICESARYCKITNKKSPQFNYWTALETIQRIISMIDQGYKIIICDRGIFDAITWMNFYLNNKLISKKDFDTTINFYMLNEWRQYVHCVVAITCDPQISINRDIDYKEFEVYGSIVNPQILPQINKAIIETIEDYKKHFNKLMYFDTSDDLSKMKKRIVNDILNTLVHYLQ